MTNKTSNHTILIVDDSPTIIKNLTHALEESGFSVVAAESGEAGLKAAQENQSLDLIITDVHMPGMDGIEMCEKIISGGFKKPIMMLTQERRDDFAQKAKAAGAVGWMIKPFHKKDVITAINQALGIAA